MKAYSFLFALVLPVVFAGVAAAEPTTQIKVDQVGYLSDAPKIAFVVSPSPADTFQICRARDGSVVFNGKLPDPVEDADTGDRVQIADFSRLNTPGAYYLQAASVGRSWTFQIGRDIYRRAFYLTMRAFYGQRCGTAVDLGPEFPGYRHAACHLTGAFHASSGKTGARASAQGWHDAGDYGRYVVNSGISTGELLWAWELFGPRLQRIDLHLPESGNKIPDMLNEIRWNLDWMLSMQDTDGGVWHKQTSEQFCPFVMPEDDHLTSYVIGTGSEPFKSSCATADFVAVMAIAARAFQPFDRAYSQTAARAAERGWTWLEKNPNVLYRNPAGVGTGGYGDRSCADENLWAAAELWRTTRKPVYQQYFLEHFREFLPAISATRPPSWGNVAALALWTYVLGKDGDQAAAEQIREASLAAAEQIVARTAGSHYHHSLTTADYVWGSNAVAANYGVQLLVANAMRPKGAYQEAALENLHYLLGRNTFSLSWVTRLGENPFRHPHHRPSGADSNPEPWPGLLSGGPNQNRQDPAMRRLPNLPPARMYLDEQESYASNEIAINWNAPLVFLLAGVLAQ